MASLAAVIYLPAILGLLPAPWNDRLGRFTLFCAAQQMVTIHRRAGLFSPAQAALILLAWPTTGLLTAAILITRRDT